MQIFIISSPKPVETCRPSSGGALDIIRETISMGGFNVHFHPKKLKFHATAMLFSSGDPNLYFDGYQVKYEVGC